MPARPPRKRRRLKPGISVEVIGDEIGHLKNTNRIFQEHLNKVLMSDAIQPTANFVESMAKSLAPRLTGHLIGTIRQKVTKITKNQAKIRIGPDYRKYKGRGFYAAWQEFGVKGRFPAVRYMRRARIAAVPILTRLLKTATNKAIKTYKPPKPSEAA